ncbi:radical SAM protein, partial [bacterium]|nr:radical SAM protein [bacterium]
DLVLRDIDILKKFRNIEVGLTINSFNGHLKRIFEPFSPTNEKRIRALKILKENKIKTYTFVSPIIPGLIDLENVIKKTKDFTDFYWFEMINIRLAGEEFVKVLRKEFPESFEIVKDKAKFDNFIRECKRVVSLERINVRGIEIH